MLSMYDISILPLIRNLNNLSHILKLGETYVAHKKIEPSVLLQSRLFVDMYPLIRQVQLTSDMSKGAGARLAGIAIPQYEDTEMSFADCYARIDKTIAFLESISAERLIGSESKEVTLTIRKVDLNFNGLDYLQKWVMPNVYFHVTTAYNILRHAGVDLGKSDFLGKSR